MVKLRIDIAHGFANSVHPAVKLFHFVFFDQKRFLLLLDHFRSKNSRCFFDRLWLLQLGDWFWLGCKERVRKVVGVEGVRGVVHWQLRLPQEQREPKRKANMTLN